MKHRKRTPGRRALHRRLRRNLLLQILVLLGLLVYANADTLKAGIDMVLELREEAVMLTEGISAGDFKQNQPGTAYAADGTILTRWVGEKDCVYTALEDIPQTVVDAFLCMEDRRFWEHEGVDYKALVRAFVALVKNRGAVTQGGSTVTMQLARNRFLTQEVSWRRKVKEIFLAQELEKHFTKEQILEFYLNNIYFGNGYYGIMAASRGYFNRDVQELTPAEMVFLCAIPNNPTRYHPLLHMEETLARKDRILGQMLQQGYLSEEEYGQALAADICLEEGEKPQRRDYEETYTTYCAVRALMEVSGFRFRYDFQDEAEREDYEEAYADCYAECQQLLYTEGYRVYTSLDLKLQGQLQEAVDITLADFAEKNDEGIYSMQGAAVCIDNDTGYVSAIVGGRKQEYEGYTLNRAYQSFRQPGSAIKPLIVYTPVLERGYTLDSAVVDSYIPDGPRNATKSYVGKTTLWYAVVNSLNTVAWNLFAELTPETGLSYLKKMEFSGIEAKDYALPAAVGGLTRGVSPLEMTAAFAAIANGGVFRSPGCVVRITDAEGKVLYGKSQEGKRVYAQAAAEMMTDALTGVMAEGTGKEARLEQMPCAGKTGTTNDCKDIWLVGYTGYYTTGVWVGYDMPREIPDVRGASYAGEIWKTFMERAHVNLEERGLMQDGNDSFSVREDGDEE